MTDERKADLIELVRRDYIRGITQDEILAFEIEYSIECSNKHCTGCILKWLKRIIPLYDEQKAKQAKRKSKKQTDDN